MFNFINPIKGYLYAVGAAVIAGLIGIYKYRGFKVEVLETELEAAEHKAVVVDKVIKAEAKKAGFVGDNRVAAAKAEANDIVLPGTVQPKDYVKDKSNEKSSTSTSYSI